MRLDCLRYKWLVVVIVLELHFIVDRIYHLFSTSSSSVVTIETWLIRLLICDLSMCTSV